MNNNTQPAAGGQQSLAPSPSEIISVLKDIQLSDTFPVKQTLLDDLSARQAMDKLTFEDAVEVAREVMLAGGAIEKAMAIAKNLFQPGDIIEFCAIPPGAQLVALHGDPHDAEQGAEMAEFVQKHLGHANLYVGICPRKAHMSGMRSRAKNMDVLCRRHVVLDLDDQDATDVDLGWLQTVEVLKRHGPALTVRSGNGWQIWINIEEQAGDALHQSASTLKDALAVIGADNTGDFSRLMRLPYTLNIPNLGKRQKGCAVRFAGPVNVQASQEAAA